MIRYKKWEVCSLLLETTQNTSGMATKLKLLGCQHVWNQAGINSVAAITQVS